MKRNFFYITLADFIVRSAYQMGKTPLLPIFAALLGASDAFLGLIVSVSTVTGLLLKPLFGILSDRWGRRVWLLIGTSFFTGVPFLYRFVSTPEHLLAIRLLHGVSTAIYGPVTLAYIAKRSKNRIAEDVGWFEIARSGGYIVGPALAGWLLLTIEPATVFTMIGLMSALAFVPVLLLEEYSLEPPTQRQPLGHYVRQALKTGGQVPAVWLSGGLKAISFVALYTNKAFLPAHGLAIGLDTLQIGLFFSIQEAAHVLLKGIGGRLGDKLGHLWTISLGMALLSLALCLLPLFTHLVSLFVLAAIMGGTEALIFPSAVALASNQVNKAHLGAAMGLTGMMDNLGKILGPILGGILLAWLDFATTYTIMGGLLFLGMLFVVGVGMSERKSGGNA